VAEYEHGDDGCAVIGLGVYRGEAFPTLDGIYFSGEYCTGEIRGLQRNEQGVWQFQNLLDTALQITGSGQDANGDLYMSAVTGEKSESGNRTGSVWKLVSADQVPDGATTVPLGEPRQAVAVDEEGEPIAEGNAPSPSAGAEATPAAQASSAESANEIVIETYDFYFAPDHLVIPANTDVRLIVENHGQAPHNFMVNKRNNISVDVEPGESAETIINLPSGEYKFVCNVPGHKQLNMNGVLVAK
jgi:plastocyanin